MKVKLPLKLHSTVTDDMARVLDEGKAVSVRVLGWMISKEPENPYSAHITIILEVECE